MTEPFPHTLKVTRWRQTTPNTGYVVRGRASLLMVEIGLQIHGIWIAVNLAGIPLATMPQRCIKTANGFEWLPCGEFPEVADSDRFSAAAWAAIVAEYPKVAPHPSTFRQFAA